jgi:site-specific DNA-methyltransferase (cytosine-N4-specific)
MLTDPDDLVVDIFGGSNTTGQVAEVESRRWVAFEALPEYVAASSFRFLEKDTPLELMKSIYSKIVAGESISSVITSLTDHRTRRLAADR